MCVVLTLGDVFYILHQLHNPKDKSLKIIRGVLFCFFFSKGVYFEMWLESMSKTKTFEQNREQTGCRYIYICVCAVDLMLISFATENQSRLACKASPSTSGGYAGQAATCYMLLPNMQLRPCTATCNVHDVVSIGGAKVS